MLEQVFFDSMQKIQIVLALKEHCLTVIAAIIEVIILVGQKRCVSAGHGILWVSGASDLRVLKELGGLVHRTQAYSPGKHLVKTCQVSSKKSP